MVYAGYRKRSLEEAKGILEKIGGETLMPTVKTFQVFFFFLNISVQFTSSVMSDSLRPHESQHATPPSPSPTPGVHSDSRPSSQ